MFIILPLISYKWNKVEVGSLFFLMRHSTSLKVSLVNFQLFDVSKVQSLCTFQRYRTSVQMQ